MTFDEWVAQYADEDAVELAKRVIREAPELVLAVVIHAIGRLRSQATREHSALVLREFTGAASRPTAWASLTRAAGSDAVAAPATDALTRGGSTTALLAQMRGVDLKATFEVDGKQITWGDATAKQHELRAAVLRASMRLAESAIEKHEAAARMLRQSGSTCLNAMRKKLAARTA